MFGHLDGRIALAIPKRSVQCVLDDDPDAFFGMLRRYRDDLAIGLAAITEVVTVATRAAARGA